jgi:hypothetical protein
VDLVGTDARRPVDRADLIAPAATDPVRSGELGSHGRAEDATRPSELGVLLIDRAHHRPPSACLHAVGESPSVTVSLRWIVLAVERVAGLPDGVMGDIERGCVPSGARR